MGAEAGHRLLVFLHELQAVKVAEFRWQLDGSIWQAVVDVEPRRWLGWPSKRSTP
ncbi:MULTISPECIES: hypothetical protein [Amycolatopsis]|uniref:hypothetical protein n=1 Tax=Amycolatopsis TaxID=1813 RepID=UPI002108216D|nr:hypothetical protein [Amycolatopsis sp. TNS106]